MSLLLGVGLFDGGFGLRTREKTVGKAFGFRPFVAVFSREERRAKVVMSQPGGSLSALYSMPFLRRASNRVRQLAARDRRPRAKKCVVAVSLLPAHS